MSMSNLLMFLDEHPNTTSIAVPEFWSQTARGPSSQDWPRQSWLEKPRPHLREWILRDDYHAFCLAYLHSGGALPNMSSWNAAWECSGLHQLDPILCARVEVPDSDQVLLTADPNLSATSLNLSQPCGGPFPAKTFVQVLGRVKKRCPNLRALHLGIVAQASIFREMLPLSGIPSPQLPGVALLSVQRVPSDWGLSNPEASLHYILALPWTKMFPDLKTIRIMEDIDFDEARRDLNLQLLGKLNSAVCIEDRFGEPLFEKWNRRAADLSVR